jgi:hypothetical protein
LIGGGVVGYVLRKIYDHSINKDAALSIARQYGGIDGKHHKAWVIDQMCRALLGNKYEQFVADAKAGEDGPETYDWDEGIAP